MNIPDNVTKIITVMQAANYEAYLVGGCVRDILLNRPPKDWDLTTNAEPQEIIDTFEDAGYKVVYENNFGTVAIIQGGLDKNDPCYAIEITPYRSEGAYSDFRRPDEISFSKHINEDLKRRDFTVNGMAFDPITQTLIDQFKGQEDLQAGIIRAIGDPTERFNEDALRMLRAIRFSAQLGFVIDPATLMAIKQQVHLIRKISAERIRDELIKIFDAPHAAEAFKIMEKIEMLQHIIPEFTDSVGCEQGGAHHFDVWTHLLKSLEHASNKNYSLTVKIAALFHDIGKPATRRASKNPSKKAWTFYGHEVVGANMTEKVLKRLRFPKELSKNIVTLVRYHMFFSDPESITLSAVRRMIRNVGKENIWQLMDLRTCDRIGTGLPKEEPYRLRQYYAMIEEVIRDPVSVGMLAINGDIMIAEMGMKPGKHMGWILHALLQEVLDDPQKNTRDYLEPRALALEQLPLTELEQLGKEGKEVREERDRAEVKKLHRKHHVG